MDENAEITDSRIRGVIKVEPIKKPEVGSRCWLRASHLICEVILVVVSGLLTLAGYHSASKKSLRHRGGFVSHTSIITFSPVRQDQCYDLSRIIGGQRYSFDSHP